MRFILPFQMNLRQLVLAGVVVGSFLLYSSFAWLTFRQPLIFNSPDETINYVFSERISRGEKLGFIQTADNKYLNLIRPRSAALENNELRPVSFLGAIFIWGGAAAVVGQWIIPFVSPLIISLSFLPLYGIWKRIWGERIATSALILTASQAAIIYFSARGLYHNALFAACLIFAAWGFMRWRESQQRQWLLFWLLLSGLALTIRTSEVVWLIPLMLFLLWGERHLISRRDIIIGTLVIILGCYVIFLFGRLYGIGAIAGYQPSWRGAPASGLTAIWSTVQPFGFHLMNIINNFFTYGLLIFWPSSVLILIGLTFSLNDWQNRKYLALAVYITLALAVFYGSAIINDSIGSVEATIGNSFIRYWLLIYIIWLPYAALALQKFIESVDRNWRKVLLTSSLIVFASFGIHQAWFDRVEGLAYVVQRLAVYKAVHNQVMNFTGSEAIIISDQSDKLFWPDRRVITPGDRPWFTYPAVVEAIPELVEKFPIYLYANGKDARAVSALQGVGIAIGNPRPLIDGAWLYPLVKL